MASFHLAAEDAFLRYESLPGRLPALICLTGLGMAVADSLLGLVADPRLAGHRRVLVDYPGSGNSEPIAGFPGTPEAHAALVARLCDHLDLGPAMVLGYSMGGSVGVALAALRPDLVSHLIVAEGNVAPGGGPASARIADQSAEDFVARGFAKSCAALRRAAREGDAAAAFLLPMRERCDPLSLHRDATGLVHLGPDSLGRFLGLDLPRWFLYGEKSLEEGEGTPDCPDRALLERHGVGTRIIPGSGHLMMLDNPDAFIATIAGICDGTGARR